MHLISRSQQLAEALAVGAPQQTDQRRFIHVNDQRMLTLHAQSSVRPKLAVQRIRQLPREFVGHPVKSKAVKPITDHR